jgi:hypothetical protein
MRKYSKGILGSFNDLIDTVVDSSRKGIDCMRSRPKKANRYQTAFTLVQQ